MFQVEKQLSELPAEAPEEIKSGIQAKVDALKDALKNDDLDQIKSATATLEGALQDLASAAQAAAGAAGAGAPDVDMPEAEGGDDSSDEPKPAKGKVVDAEVVD